MASDNRAYTQFENPTTLTTTTTTTPVVNYGGAGTPAVTPTITAGHPHDHEEKILKRWKNSRRLCWGMLGTSIATLVLECIGAGISGVHMDWFLIRFLSGIWLAALGVVSSALGLRAFRNLYESSKCWTLSHFVLSIISTVAYGIVFIMAAGDVYRSRVALESIHQYVEEEYDLAEAEAAAAAESMDYGINSTNTVVTTTATLSNLTTTALVDDYDSVVSPVLNAVKGNMTVSVFLLATSIAFFIMSIIANVLICRQWCKKCQKTMTIVYMQQDANGQAQAQSIVLPAKAQQVVVVPASAKSMGEPVDHFK